MQESDKVCLLTWASYQFPYYIMEDHKYMYRSTSITSRCINIPIFIITGRPYHGADGC